MLGWGDGFEICLYSENRYLEKYMQFEVISGWDLTITTIIAAGKGRSEKSSLYAHC